MSDECPYCHEEIEINHDDGYGISEGELHHQECHNCDKTFVYETSIILYYDVKKANCLNGGDHDWKKTHTYPKEYTKMRCRECGERRDLTDEERKCIVNQ